MFPVLLIVRRSLAVELAVNNVRPEGPLVEQLHWSEVVLVAVAFQRVAQHVELVRAYVHGSVHDDPLHGLVARGLRQTAVVGYVVASGRHQFADGQGVQRVRLAALGDVLQRVGHHLQCPVHLLATLADLHENGDGHQAVGLLLGLRPVGVELRIVGVQLQLARELLPVDGVLRAAVVLATEVQ